MADTGWTLGSTATAISGSWWSFSNPSNVLTDNTSAASLYMDSRDESEALQVSNFAWGTAIPSGATINGVEVRVRRYCSSTGDHEDLSMKLLVAGTASGSNYAAGVSYPTSAATQDYGGAADLWGLSLTEAQVNASNFGMALTVIDGNAGSDTSYYEAVWMKIHFTAAASGPTVREHIQYP